uniref:Uncharacterized protein n=1 Tax=Rhizophora mucronata TaxID=61149 RepID=A0A2P2R585_RHIMU
MVVVVGPSCEWEFIVEGFFVGWYIFPPPLSHSLSCFLPLSL